MRTKAKKSFLLLEMLLVLGLIFLLQIIVTFSADVEGKNEHSNEYISSTFNHNHNQATSGILDKYQGAGYSSEEIYLQPHTLGIQPSSTSVTNSSTCNSITTSHGSDRR